MNTQTVICVSCGDLFRPGTDNQNKLYIDGQKVHQFYVCDDCIDHGIEEYQQLIAAYENENALASVTALPGRDISCQQKGAPNVS